MKSRFTKTLSLASVILAFLTVVTPAVLASKLSIQQLKYTEEGDNIDVVDWVIDAQFTPDVDNEFNIKIGVDGISGATRAWSSKSGLSKPSNLNAINKKSASNVYGTDNSGYEIRQFTLPDERRYSLGGSWLKRTESRNEIQLGADYSREPDYLSHAISGSYMWFKDDRKNTSFNVGMNTRYDRVLASKYDYSEFWDDLWSVNLELGISQVMSSHSVLNANIFTMVDSGYLSNHYQTILREFDANNDGVTDVFLSADHRPSRRVALGASALWMMQWNNLINTHLGYRLYQDDWGIRSHTLESKGFVDIGSAVTLGLSLRYYDQSAASFFRRPNTPQDTFALTGFGSADHRMGDFSATTYELSGIYRLTNSVHLNAQFGVYKQSTWLDANWWAVGVTIKDE